MEENEQTGESAVASLESNFLFEGFKAGITDDKFFFGRQEILTEVINHPFAVRILIGAKRMGKTSFLNAVEGSLLDESASALGQHAFPIACNFSLWQPKNLAQLRYQLLWQLRNNIEQWKQPYSAGMNAGWRKFRDQLSEGELALPGGLAKVKINNPSLEKELSGDVFLTDLKKYISDLERFDFSGIIFLLDDADFVIRQSWANEFSSYFRGVKENSAVGSCIGLVLSGYRSLKNYIQPMNSPISDIARKVFLTTLSDQAVDNLVKYRCKMNEVSLRPGFSTLLKRLAGHHPYLVNQILNFSFENIITKQEAVRFRFSSEAEFIDSLLHHFKRDFNAWWFSPEPDDSLGCEEKAVYQALIEYREGTVKSLATQTNISEINTGDALEVLATTGIIYQKDYKTYSIGSFLFERWVSELT